MDVRMKKKEQSENFQGVGEVLEASEKQSGILSVQTARDMIPSQSGLASEEYEKDGLVPEFASAPAHLTAKLGVEFKNTLISKLADINTSILQVTNNPDIEAVLKTTVVGSLNNIQIYGGLRLADLNSPATADFATIEQALILARGNLDGVLKSIAGKIETADRELKSAERSLRWAYRQETKTAAAEEVAKKGKRLALFKSLESELMPYRKLLLQDTYSGTLKFHDEIACKDNQIKLPYNKSTTDSTTGNITEEKFLFKDRTKEPLFKKPPAVEDIRQGGLGDCYLLAGLATIVSVDPSLITGAMKDLGAEVCVRFYKDSVPIYIRVEKTVPVNEKTEKKSDGTIIHTNKSDAFARDYLWVQMIEKAYAVSGLRTGKSNVSHYEWIEGGGSDIFVSQMTGKAYTRIQMSNDESVDEGNSLIGAYKNRYGFIEGWLSPTVTIQLGRLITADHSGVPAAVLKNAARGIYMRHRSAGISVEDAVKIAVKMAENEDLHKADYSYTTASGKTKSGRRLVRASYLDELTDIVGAAAIPVPSTHTLAKTVLDRLITKHSIPHSVLTAGNAGSGAVSMATFDDTPQGKLAERIRSLYANSLIRIDHDDLITLAQLYEDDYRKQIAADMIKLLKKDDEMRLSYSPFYIRKSKSGVDKHRYTHKAMSIYQKIEENIKKGNIVTTGTVGFAKKGDSHLKSGLVESHAYSVLGTEESGDVRYVKLRNPWSKYVRIYDPANDNKPAENWSATTGIFSIELNDFISNFRTLRINS